MLLLSCRGQHTCLLQGMHLLVQLTVTCLCLGPPGVQPSAGWMPIPQGSRQPQLGCISALPPQWWAVFPQYRQRSAQLLGAGPSPALQHLQQADGATSPHGAAAVTPPQAASLTEQRTQQMSQQHGREQEQEQQHPSTQPARALRRIEQPGVRSILKASQPPGVEPTWGEASQQLPGVLLVGSDPTSTRVPRRVQFQLPEQAASGSLAGAAIDEDAGDNGGSSQAQHSHINQQEAGGSAAVGDMQHSKAKSRGKRRLLPQLPQALAQEEEEGGDGTNNPAWKQRLQQRRQRLSS